FSYYITSVDHCNTCFFFVSLYFCISPLHSLLHYNLSSILLSLLLFSFSCFFLSILSLMFYHSLYLFLLKLKPFISSKQESKQFSFHGIFFHNNFERQIDETFDQYFDLTF